MIVSLMQLVNSGYGTVEEKNGKQILKEHQHLSFNDTLSFYKTLCN
jgi:hypothetical protein